MKMWELRKEEIYSGLTSVCLATGSIYPTRTHSPHDRLIPFSSLSPLCYNSLEKM